MNRCIWNTPEEIDTRALPPLERAGVGPVRMLFLSGAELGFVTTSRMIQRFAGARDDVDAVHLCLPMRGLTRLLCRTAPRWLRGWDFPSARVTRVLGVQFHRVRSALEPLDRFDVIHILSQQRAWPIVHLRGRTRSRLVVNIDATVPAWDRAFGGKRPRLDLDRAVEARVLDAADVVVCSTQWSAASARQDYGLDPERLVLHKHCAVREPGSPFRDHADAHARGTPGLPKIRIMFVGNDWVRKGGPRLLAWHQQRWADRAELHVCSSRAPRDPAARSVVWHGATPHDRLIRELLPQADLMVVPTSWDTFMVAAQEAQGAGLPVVTSRFAGLPEVVDDGVTGFLCSRDDDAAFIAAVERLLREPDLRRSMGWSARDHAARNLNAAVWHNHLLDQLVAVGRGGPVQFVPSAERGAAYANKPLPTIGP